MKIIDIVYINNTSINLNRMKALSLSWEGNNYGNYVNSVYRRS